MAANTRMEWISRFNHIPGYGKGMTANARNALHGFADRIIKRLRKEMREPKHGRVYIINGRRHVASAPNEAPAILSGRTSRSLRAKESTTGAEVQITAGGASRFLQEGTSRMRPRRFIREILQEDTPQFVKDMKAALRFRERGVR